jgi:hypothetical protein
MEQVTESTPDAFAHVGLQGTMTIVPLMDQSDVIPA